MSDLRAVRRSSCRGLDLVLVLAHCSLDDNLSIAGELNGVDVVFSAHKHSMCALPNTGETRPFIHYFVDRNA